MDSENIASTWFLFMSNPDVPVMYLKKSLNEVGLAFKLSGCLGELVWHHTVIKQVIDIIRGIVKVSLNDVGDLDNVEAGTVDVEDSSDNGGKTSVLLSAQTGDFKLNFVNLWPTCGLLNRSGI